MSVLFIIAITASVLSGMLLTFSIASTAPYPKINSQSSALKQLLYKAIDWLNLDEAPIRRRISLRILFSVLVITALGCGFYDTYSSFEPTERNCFNALGSCVITIASFIFIIMGCIGIAHPIKMLTTNYFQLECCDADRHGSHYKNRLRNCIVLNSFILCILLATFVIFSSLCNGCGAFVIICVSVVTTAVLLCVLTALGFICYLLFLLIEHLLLTYIEWLKN